MKKFLLLAALFVGLFSVPLAQAQAQSAPAQLARRVSKLEQEVASLGGGGLIVFVFGGVCALWAQNTGRNAWLWFFLGVFFSFITILVMLYKNSGDIDRRRAALRRAT